MRKLQVTLLVALMVAVCSSTLLGEHQELKPEKKILGIDYQLGLLRGSELRHDAITTVMPIYPDEAQAAGAQGLVNVAVVFDEKGDFARMQVLESPHAAITQAVSDALKQWKIKIGYDSPYQEFARPIRPFAEVRFHFVIRDGVPTVEPAMSEEQMRTSKQFHDYSSRAGKCLVSLTMKKKSDTDRCFDPAYIAKIPGLGHDPTFN
jgi:TonB family protein